MKTFVLCIICITLAGCIKTPALYSDAVERISYTHHQKHGLVKITDSQYVSSMKSCESKIYTSSVLFNGKEINSHTEAGKAYAKYYLDTTAEIESSMNTPSAVHAGTMAALSVTTGKSYAPSYSKKKVDRKILRKRFNSMKHSDEFYTLANRIDAYGECLNKEEGWTLIKTDFIEKSTGKVLKTTEFSPLPSQL